MASIRFKHGKASAQLVSIDESRYKLSDIWTEVDSRNQGYAKGVMRKIISYADAHNLTLLLMAQRYGKASDPALENKELEMFYKKFGFRTTARAPIRMVREPSQETHVL